MTVAATVLLPPERFYWALLDTRTLLGGTAARRAHLGYLFEAYLPVPVECVHAVYTRIGDGRVLACGMSCDELDEYTQALTLGPESLPAFLDTPAAHAGSINLLVGRFEPTRVRWARGRLAIIACALVAACAVSMIIGQSRRGEDFTGRVDRFRRATADVYDSVLGPSSSSLPPAARLTAELRSLGRTRAAGGDELGLQDISPTLSAMLARWPRGLHVTTQSLRTSRHLIALEIRAPDQASAERLERELRAPPGWRVGQPTVQRERDGLSVRVRMEPEGRP